MTNETDTTQTEETYLGDSTFVYLQEDGLIILTRRFSDGSERKIRMDEVVLSEFLAWFCGNKENAESLSLMEPPFNNTRL